MFSRVQTTQKFSVLRFKVENPLYARQVDAGFDKFGDASEANQIFLAVTTGSAAGPRGRQQSAPFVQPQCLRPDSGQLRCDRYSIHPATRPGHDIQHHK